jgi:hypothetical protein
MMVLMQPARAFAGYGRCMPERVIVRACFEPVTLQFGRIPQANLREQRALVPIDMLIGDLPFINAHDHHGQELHLAPSRRYPWQHRWHLDVVSKARDEPDVRLHQCVSSIPPNVDAERSPTAPATRRSRRGYDTWFFLGRRGRGGGRHLMSGHDLAGWHLAQRLGAPALPSLGC